MEAHKHQQAEAAFQDEASAAVVVLSSSDHQAVADPSASAQTAARTAAAVEVHQAWKQTAVPVA